MDYTLDAKGTQIVSVENAVDAAVSGSAVTVTPGTPPMWEIKAVAKGTASVLFYDATSTLLKTIKVKVNNQAPTIATDKLPTSALELSKLRRRTALAARKTDGIKKAVWVVTLDSGTADVAVENFATDAAAEAPNVVDFGDFFKDADAADKRTVTVKSLHPQYALVAGYKKDGSRVYVDVIDSPTSVLKIDLSVTVTDGTATVGPVTVSVAIPSDLLSQTYEASQSGLKVKDILPGLRPGPTHTITGIMFPIPGGYKTSLSEDR